MVKKITPFLKCCSRFQWDNVLVLYNLCISNRKGAIVSIICQELLRLRQTGKPLFPRVLKTSETTLIIAKSCQENTIGERTAGEWDVHLAISENWTWRKEHKPDNTDDFEYKYKKYKHTLYVITIAWICTQFLSSQDFKVLFIYVISFIFSASLWNNKDRYNHPHVADRGKWGVERWLHLLGMLRYKSDF